MVGLVGKLLFVVFIEILSVSLYSLYHDLL